MTVKVLVSVAVVTGVVSIVIIAIVFLYPDSVFVCTLDRFQTLFTGVLAGLIAFLAAGFFYRAAKLPVEAERIRRSERRKALKTAGAAQLLSAVQGIYLAVITEASKPSKDRRGKLMVPDALPSLETISTQDDELILELSRFLETASKYDAHTLLNTWPYDPDETHADEKIVLDDLTAKRDKLRDILARIAAGGQSKRPS